MKRVLESVLLLVVFASPAYASDGYLAQILLIWFVVALVLFLILRELVCWYWKINLAITLLSEIRDHLRIMRNSMTSGFAAGPAAVAGGPQQGSIGWTSRTLTGAVREGDVHALRTLIAAGADVNEKGVGGESPLDIAIAGNHIEIVKILVESGAKIEHNILGKSQIKKARELGYTEIHDFLLNHEMKRPVV